MPDIDKERLARRTKAEILDEVEVLLEDNDQEHRQARREQVGSIRNLMRGRSYEEEMEVLHDRIVTLERELEMAKEELRKNQGQLTPAHNIRVIR